jgi:hypothetical protein
MHLLSEQRWDSATMPLIDIVFHTLRISIGFLLILMYFGNSLTIALVDGKKLITKSFLWFKKQYCFEDIGINVKGYRLGVYDKMTKQRLFTFSSNAVSIVNFVEACEGTDPMFFARKRWLLLYSSIRANFYLPGMLKKMFILIIPSLIEIAVLILYFIFYLYGIVT